jgi:hypothetical protein
MKPPAEVGSRRSIRRLVHSDEGLTVLLISLFLLLFVLYPLSEPGSIGQYLVDAFAVLVMISGVYAVSDRSRLLLYGVIALALVSFGLQLLPYAYLNRSTLLLNNASTMLFLIAVTGVVLYRVLRKGPITVHRIQGAVAVYLMLGLIWALAYSLVFISDPSAFALGRSIEGTTDLIGINTQGMSRLIYFSFVTMTTLGYGDIAPHGRLAENLAILQALTGQIYLVVIMARLVSLAVTTADRE